MLCYRIREFRAGVQIGEVLQDIYIVISGTCPYFVPRAGLVTTSQQAPILYDPMDSQTSVVPVRIGQPTGFSITFQDTATSAPVNALRATVVWLPPGLSATITGTGTNILQVRLQGVLSDLSAANRYILINVENNAPVRRRWDFTCTLSLAMTTGMEASEKAHQWVLVPNPTSTASVLRGALPGDVIRVLSPQGQVLWQTTVEVASVNLPVLPAGVYFVQRGSEVRLWVVQP